MFTALLVPAAVACPPVFGWSRYAPEGFLTTCCFDFITLTWTNRAFVAYLYVLGFGIPCTMIAVSYMCISVSLQKHRLTASSRDTMQTLQLSVRTFPEQGAAATEITAPISSVSSSSATTTCSRRETGAMVSIAYVFALFLLAWLPYALIGVIGVLDAGWRVHWVTPYSVAVAGILAKSSCAYNPIIYAMVDPVFRRHMIAMLRKSRERVSAVLCVSRP
jgi:r-opsin